MKLPTRQFKLSIDVTVNAGACDFGPSLCGLVHEAVVELVNRHDFKAGLIEQGRVITHHYDHSDIVVTVDLTRMHVPPPGEAA